MDRLEKLKLRLKELPERPGVYLHKNAEGEVIYVGKARNLRNRVQSYLVGRGARDAKTMTLINEIDAIDFVTTNNELEAILLENNLIKSHQPRYNILLRDDKTYPYIKVTVTEDFPRVVFTRRVDRKKGDLYYGPFFAGTARRLLKLIADQFKLRSCDLVIRDGNVVDRRELFWEKVGDYQPGYFLSEVLQRYYQDNLFIPREILLPFDVEDEELLAEWMSSQAGRKVHLRVPRRGRGVDRLELANRNARLSHESRFRKSQQDRLQIAAQKLVQVLGYEREIERIESFDISNIQGSDSVAGMVVLDRGKFDKNQYRVFNIRSVVGADDFRSMAEAVDRRYRRLLEEGKALPDLILIDGGRGQLNAALAALKKLGIEEMPIAGLAKREEEIYVPEREEPIRLERRDPALQLLQMVRDETHRFAVSSHRRRRSKRILHSELDDFPGIGEKRRRLLIERFGSVSGVKQASMQDLMNVLGRNVGQRLYDELHA